MYTYSSLHLYIETIITEFHSIYVRILGLPIIELKLSHAVFVYGVWQDGSYLEIEIHYQMYSILIIFYEIQIANR